MNFEAAEKMGQWTAIRDCPGRFVLRGCPRSLGVSQLLGAEAQARAYRSPKARDSVWVVRFEGGGIISYAHANGSWVHTLNTESGFRRKLAQLDIHLTDLAPASAFERVRPGLALECSARDPLSFP